MMMILLLLLLRGAISAIYAVIVNQGLCWKFLIRVASWRRGYGLSVSWKSLHNLKGR